MSDWMFNEIVNDKIDFNKLIQFSAVDYWKLKDEYHLWKSINNWFYKLTCKTCA